MWKRTEYEMNVEKLDEIELENKPYNGWLKSDRHSAKSFKSFGFKNCFKKKNREKVRQMDHSFYDTISSAYTGLSIAGIECSHRFAKKGFKRIVFYVWHYFILTLLILFNITSLLSVCFGTNKLPLMIDFIRIGAVLYRFVILTNQKNKLDGYIDKVEKSLDMFPNVKLVKSNYSKVVAFVVFYACAQGFALFRQVKDHKLYINQRYFTILDHLITNPKHAKIFVLIDVWIKSFLFRSIFIMDVLLGSVFQRQLYKRQHLLTRLLRAFCANVSQKKNINTKTIISNFRETYRRVRECVLTYDNIYGPGMVLWFSFFSLYCIAEINNFLAKMLNDTGQGSLVSPNFVVRVIAILVVSQFNLIVVSRSTDETDKSIHEITRLSTIIDQEDAEVGSEVDLLKGQIYVHDVRITCWQLFYITRNTIVRGVLMTVYYIIVSLQLQNLTKN